MAFNFNWSPLTADESFYRRARDLLTTALNKSPKPPIIVDDIYVNELNLGSVPPELEILEIGDLAEDRFRGIFKMCYSGDAFLTLKTRVQANPLNTYLYSKPTFTSPQPLAAASGLTIPLSLTLSEIKLSAFIILVFSKQKGLTLVFRNDPLESLKVSSTFDSIPFVRDYLQRTIEGKLRDLMMDELPAIIHRLSLQLWCPEQVSKQETSSPTETEETAVDPLASPPLDAVDAQGNLLDPTELSSLHADGTSETQSLFSQKNLVRLAALTNSHRTLSLFTPGIRDVVVRARAGSSERSDPNHTPPLSAASLVRTHSAYDGNATTYTFSDTSSQQGGYLPPRSSTVSLGSASSSATGMAFSPGRHTKSGRKKKTRVVNLRRKTKTEEETPSEAAEATHGTASAREPSLSDPVISGSIPEEEEDDDVRTVISPPNMHFDDSEIDHEPAHLQHRSASPVQPQSEVQQPERATIGLDVFKNPKAVLQSAGFDETDKAAASGVTASGASSAPIKLSAETTGESSSGESKAPMSYAAALAAASAGMRGNPDGRRRDSMEQALIMKMAGEIARRVYEENKSNAHFWNDREDAPPPAYGEL